ncbi:MAG TPA: TlpA disulfide reductase family protein [Steroidobacteraceae bacterium]|nr:TlpA disulfide reductase family protein [Steroidobacteraceae bacterium]
MHHYRRARRLAALRAALSAAALTALAAGFDLTPGAAAARGVEVGQPAPALLAPELDGRTFDLAAERGKVVIVNFWATWCGPCRAEMPLLNRFYLAHRAQGLALVGVSVDDRHDRKEVAEVMRQFAYPAVLASSAGENGFGPPLAVPMTWIIDANGVVRARLVSAVTEQALEQAVLPLLPQSATATAH